MSRASHIIVTDNSGSSCFLVSILDLRQAAFSFNTAETTAPLRGKGAIMVVLPVNPSMQWTPLQ